MLGLPIYREAVENEKMDKQKAYSLLAYQLIYPGVLGSMIFDLADPFRDFSWIWLCSVVIALCFVVDYLHLTLNLCADGTSPLKHGPWMDALIAILFCISYFSLSHASTDRNIDLEKHVLTSIGVMTFVQILIVIYDYLHFKRTSIIDYVPVAICILGFIALYSLVTDSLVILFCAYASLLCAYVYRVIIHIPSNNNELA